MGSAERSSDGAEPARGDAEATVAGAEAPGYGAKRKPIPRKGGGRAAKPVKRCAAPATAPAQQGGSGDDQPGRRGPGGNDAG